MITFATGINTAKRPLATEEQESLLSLKKSTKKIKMEALTKEQKQNGQTNLLPSGLELLLSGIDCHLKNEREQTRKELKKGQQIEEEEEEEEEEEQRYEKSGHNTSCGENKRIKVSVHDLLLQDSTVSSSSSPSTPPFIEDPFEHSEPSSDMDSFSPCTAANQATVSLNEERQAFVPTTTSHDDTTNVNFYYPCAAQKSYGSEKRFLCPPPVVALTGKKLPYSPDVTITVQDYDNNEMEHHSKTDENNRASFKQIHVSSSSKGKVFQLKLKVAFDKCTPLLAETPPISIISKPSTKTTKSRNNALAINSGDMICLFNRVNSQTVRTKYMGIEKKKFCAKGSSWSPFIIKRATLEVGVPVCYGMEVILIDLETGLSSDPWIVRKVVKNTLVDCALGPVTQLQKIALQPKNNPTQFLSIVPSPAYGTYNPFLCFLPQRRDPPIGEKTILDYMSWTIVRIEKTRCQIDPARDFSLSLQNGSIEVKGPLVEKCSVFFGSQPLRTLQESSGVKRAQLPTFSVQCGQCLKHPIILVKPDGTLLHTGVSALFEKKTLASPVEVSITRD